MTVETIKISLDLDLEDYNIHIKDIMNFQNKSLKDAKKIFNQDINMYLGENAQNIIENSKHKLEN